jgi:DNA (cytosine-5)-methyltransferase 1
MYTKNVLSLFTGCGGLDLGFEGGFAVRTAFINDQIHRDWTAKTLDDGWTLLQRNPFNLVFANDIKASAMNVWRGNFTADPNIYVLGSIIDLVKQAEIDQGPLLNLKADVVTGGFPCQDFSFSGKRLGFKSRKSHRGVALEATEDPTFENRGMLYMWMRKVVELVDPKCFVAENVKGLASMDKVKQTIESDFKAIGGGYIVVPAKVLHAPDYGVPQTRDRVIFYGFNKRYLNSTAIAMLEQDVIPAEYDPYPVRTHNRLGEIDPNLQESARCHMALANLAEPTASTDLDHRHYSRAKWYGKHCQGNKEINMQGPGPTIRSEHHGNIEFRRLSAENGGKNFQELSAGLEQRRLSVRECARIQTFPDTFRFISDDANMRVSPSDAYKLVGNAVPPLLGYHIAYRLNEIWPRLFITDVAPSSN